MNESAIEKAACKRILKEFGWLNIKLNGPGRRGWPDRLFLSPVGKVAFIEFKRPGGKLTELQAYSIDMLRERGYSAAVCDNVEGAVQFIGGLSNAMD